MKRFEFYYICMLLCSIVLLMGCDDIIEEDISDNLITPISPLQGDLIEGQFVNFQWQPLDGADDYRVQVYDNNINTGIVLDSLVSTTQLGVNLDFGDYNWVVRGENFAYVTGYNIPLGFQVNFSDDLSSQLINLSTPSSFFYTNNPNVLYTWEENNAAISYDFELLKNLNGITTVTQESGILDTNFMVAEALYDEDAEYIWSIRGVNDNSQTDYFERSIFIDRIAPNVPLLIQPDNQQETSDLDIIFEWSIGADTGNVQSERSSTIELASNTNFDVLLDSLEVPAGASVTYTFPDIGVYYWRVKSQDLAGNESVFSEIRTFTIL